MRDQGRAATIREVAHWCEQKPGGADILAEFTALSAAPVTDAA
jgi:hypothetical protein